MNSARSIAHIRYFDFVVPAALTLRTAGDCSGATDETQSRRTELFREYCREVSLWPRVFFVPQQVHKRRVRVLSPRTFRSSLRGVDGLISADTTHSLAVTVADCLPIYLAVPTRGIVALLHSGRKSTGILARALTLLSRRYRVAPSEIYLLFGPAIASCCYEVGADIAAAYRRHWGEDTVLARDGAYYLDIIRANEHIAHAAGVFRVDIVGECTCCNRQYHSYRRDGSAAAGRMLALISNWAGQE